MRQQAFPRLFGVKRYIFGINQIEIVEQFRERIPILSYSSYEPYLDRVAQGETNILTLDPVKCINLTSGSTGKQKLITPKLA